MRSRRGTYKHRRKKGKTRDTAEKNFFARRKCEKPISGKEKFVKGEQKPIRRKK
jgi:hypothetical protein